ncbi:LysM domain-containing protein [Trichoderma cornu-damae]|uniref:LysM domain-containing protein n=1 Tax=Trichoderma cornu-damae TaxID=654480 RepID=A0A9P8QMU1_9HYPO|nr:LysM domain-containing protein [Trichoderma cornu-damae]
MANRALLLLAGLATLVVSEPIRWRGVPVETAAVARRQGQGVPDDCTFFDTATSADQDCEYFASLWGITVKDFIAWNPSVGADCSGIQVGQQYCVERNYGIPVPSSTTSGGSTGPTGTVPSPVQDGIIKTCTGYYKAVTGDDCSKIVAKFGTFTFADFLAWNPAVGETCGGLWLDYYYCVATPEKPTGTKSSSAPAPTSSVPSPVQDGITPQCKTYYKAVSGDDCSKIVAKYGTFTFADFLKWNPAVGDTCSGLWLDYYYCVGVAETPTQKPTTTSKTTTSVPTQTGIVKDCQRWYQAVSGDTCAGIVSKFGTFTLSQFLQWNPAVGASCSTLLPGYNYCIGVTGTPTQPPQPSTTACAGAPTPTQPGAVCPCKKWHMVVSGNTCDSIEKQYGITAAQFNKWNPQVGATCTTLWLGYNVCVSA